MGIRTEVVAQCEMIGRELDAVGREIDDLKEYVGNSDRISPMLPGGRPKSSYPPPADRVEEG